MIPVLWLMARFFPGAIWYSYLIAYLLEAAIIYLLHKKNHIEFVIALRAG